MDADDYLKAVPPASRRSKLAPWLADIRKLRANGYTLEQVREFLSQNGVEISIAGVSAYVKRMEARQEKEVTKPAAPAAGKQPPQAGEGSAGAEVAPAGAIDAPAAEAGKTRTETILASEPKPFSFKQLQRKDQKS